MPQEKNILVSWKIPEHIRHQRSQLWYLVAAASGALFIFYGVFTNNFLFALAVVLFAVVYLLMHMQEPPFLDFKITEKGVELGNKNYDYADITGFWLVARDDHKSLHLRTKFFSSPLLSIPLVDTSPEAVRGALSKFVSEDTSEKEEPLLEVLGRRFKL